MRCRYVLDKSKEGRFMQCFMYTRTSPQVNPLRCSPVQLACCRAYNLMNGCPTKLLSARL